MRFSYGPRSCGISLLSIIVTVATAALNAAERPLWRTIAKSDSAQSAEYMRVKVDSSVLVRGPTPDDSQFDISLPDGSAYRAVIESTRFDGPERFVSTGRLIDQPFSDFLFLVDHGRVGGVITPHPAVRLRILPTDDGNIHRVVSSLMEDCPPGGSRRPDPQILQGPGKRKSARLRTEPAAPATGVVEPQGTLGSVIDVLIVYTQRARSSLGGVAGAQMAADLAVELANQAYLDSGVFQRLRLVHAAEVDYVESGSASTDLDALTRPADGLMDNAITLRLEYRADLVHLFVNGSDMSDLGWLNNFSTFNQTWSFSLSNVPFLQADVFTRGVGSNQGIFHDWRPPPMPPLVPPEPFPYSFGYAFTGNSGNRWGTIMSNVSPSTRIRRHSNPTLFFDGAPTGQPLTSANPAHAALSLNNTAATIAAITQGNPVPPPVISSPITAFGTVNVAFTYQITATNGPQMFGAAGLPLGLSVNTSNGLITGTPRQSGVFSVELTAINEGGTGIKILTLTIDEPTDCPLQRVARRLKPLGLIPPGLLSQSSTDLLNGARRFRDDVLRATPEGRELIEVYYRHGAAVFGALNEHPDLMRNVAECWVDLMPAIEASRSENPLLLNSAQAARIQTLLDRLEAELDEQSRAAIVAGRKWLRMQTVVR